LKIIVMRSFFKATFISSKIENTKEDETRRNVHHQVRQTGKYGTPKRTKGKVHDEWERCGKMRKFNGQ
jgi:hypothetical protein